MGEKYKIGTLRAGNVAIGDHATYYSCCFSVCNRAAA